MNWSNTPKVREEPTPRQENCNRGSPTRSPPTHGIKGSKNADQPAPAVEEFEPINTAPRRFERVRQPIEFYQLGLDYVNYMDAGEPCSYEEVIAAPDGDTWR